MPPGGSHNPYILGVINFGKKNWVVIKFFDDQNVGSHKMTTDSHDDDDSVFILFKKTDFNTILACFGQGVRCISDEGS